MFLDSRTDDQIAQQSSGGARVIYIDAWLAGRDYNVTSGVDAARQRRLRERMDKLTGRADPDRARRNKFTKRHFHID
jgi:hypothetical protein